MPTPRDRRLAINDSHLAAWRERDPVAAAFYDSLSALFPQGERFFMDSVRRYRDGVDAGLAEAIRQFIAQEALHTREYLAFNNQVRAAGGDVARLEARTKAQLDAVRRRDGLVQLAATVSLEHFTAVLAHHLIACPEHLAEAPAETRALWLWHAGEEIEHKAVAFDVLAHATAHWSGARRWTFRARIYLEVLVRLFRVVIPNHLDLRRQYGPVRAPRLELARYLLSRPGLLGRMAPDLARYLAPGFHPWAVDDAGLAAEALAA